MVDPAKTQNPQQLHDAFQLFNELSQTLTESYQDLQQQVADLSKELANARNARLKTLDEKEQLANQLHGLLEALPGGVIVLDQEGRIIRQNRVAGQLLEGKLLGLFWHDLLNKRLGKPSDIPQERHLENGRRVNILTQPLGDESGQVILLTDVSEVRALQDLVNHQQRLSAMGEMVAALAHQIRTPLSAAMLYASNLGNSRLEPTQLKRSAAKLTERLRHLERQVNDMLIFARHGRLMMVEVPIQLLATRICEAVELLIAEIKVRFKFENRAKSSSVFCNEDALLGAVLNLANNAIQAMNGEGELSLEIKTTGDRLCISVQDNGPGIADSTVARLFEPFFTTRANGTGLGLAVVENVLQSHRGRAFLDPSAVHGAKFILELPLTQNEQLLPGGTLPADTVSEP